jgi:hypothetical protein
MAGLEAMEYVHVLLLIVKSVLDDKLSASCGSCKLKDAGEPGVESQRNSALVDHLTLHAENARMILSREVFRPETGRIVVFVFC